MNWTTDNNYANRSPRIRFVVIGGFLGAGKTTAIVRLAREYVAAGERVGIIANDIGQGLVDTRIYLAEGWPVEELSGKCFACRFDELLAAAGHLQEGYQPDVLLAEPSGSCTNIVSRVIAPLREVYGQRFEVAPYVTLLDPWRARAALSRCGLARFSAKVTFLHKMQQSEADVVAINKADALSPHERGELLELVASSFPRARVLCLSARDGEGFDHLRRILAAPCSTPQSGPWDPVAGRAVADGEHSLRWVDGSWEVLADPPVPANELLAESCREIQQALIGIEAEPAHVKLMLHCEGLLAIASIVGTDRPAELSRSSAALVSRAMLFINARVETRDEALRARIESAIARVGGENVALRRMALPLRRRRRISAWQ